MTKYVCGLLFDWNLEKVVLIEKRKGPEYVIGKWNAVGGKVEGQENNYRAMEREFLEETGYQTADWTKFLNYTGEDFDIDFFYSIHSSNTIPVTTMEQEIVGVFMLNNLPKIVPNLAWIIPMAIDSIYKKKIIISY